MYYKIFCHFSYMQKILLAIDTVMFSLLEFLACKVQWLFLWVTEVAKIMSGWVCLCILVCCFIEVFLLSLNLGQSAPRGLRGTNLSGASSLLLTSSLAGLSIT